MMMMIIIIIIIIIVIIVVRNWVDIEVEKVSVCVICAVRTVKVCSVVHYF